MKSRRLLCLSLHSENGSALQECGLCVFGLEINRLLHKAAITRASVFLHLNAMAGLSRLCFFVQFMYSTETLRCRSSHPKFSPSVSYLLWFSDASIMALNLEFSSASKAAGLSNSKIYENEKNRTGISAGIYIRSYLPIPCVQRTKIKAYYFV